MKTPWNKNKSIGQKKTISALPQYMPSMSYRVPEEYKNHYDYHEEANIYVLKLAKEQKRNMYIFTIRND